MKYYKKEETENLVGLYSIRNTKNNMVYIGQTTNSFLSRYNDHYGRLKNNQHRNTKLQNDYNMYGKDSFVFEVVKIESDQLILDESEKKEISKNKAAGKSYNKKPGGEKNMKTRKISEETKDKIREKNIGSNSPVSKLNEIDVLDIKKRLLANENQKTIASRYNVSIGVISAIATNRTWKHVLCDGWKEYIDSKKPKRRFTEAEVDEIRELLNSGKYTQIEISNMYNCYSSTISNINIGKSWK